MGEKLFKISVNDKTIQCRVYIPRTFWDSLPKSGYYKLTENNEVLTYLPAPEPVKKAVLPIFGTENSNETTVQTHLLSAEDKEEIDVFVED